MLSYLKDAFLSSQHLTPTPNPNHRIAVTNASMPTTTHARPPAHAPAHPLETTAARQKQSATTINFEKVPKRPALSFVAVSFS
jgi:hypothetical protein